MDESFDLSGARKAGYSFGEIADHLAKQDNFDLDGARKSGYTNRDIAAHLARTTADDRVTPADVRAEASRYGIDPDFATALITQESGGNDRTRDSPKGAAGIAQVMPATFKSMMPNGDIRNPWDNLEAGLKYMRYGADKLGIDTQNPDGQAARLLAAGYHQGYDHPDLAKGRIANTNDGLISTPQYAESIVSRYESMRRGRPAEVPMIESGGGGGDASPVASTTAQPQPPKPVVPAKYLSYDDYTKQVQATPEGKKLDQGDIADQWLSQYGTMKPPGAEPGDATRGFKNAFMQLPQLGYGIAAIAAAAMESDIGPGGLPTAAKNWSVKKYQEWGADIAKNTKESDDIDAVYEKAKSGSFGDLVDFVQYAAGYAAGQLIQAAGTGGIGYAAGKLALKPAASSLAEGLVAKQVAALTAKNSADLAAGKITQEAIQQQAVSNVAGQLGAYGGVGAHAFGMEGGEIGGDLAEKSVKEGRVITGSEIARAVGATVAAGSMEFAGDLLKLGAVTGKLTKGMTGIQGVGGRVARGATAATIASTGEGMTEWFQTQAEEYGKGNEPFTPEANKQARNAAAMGFVGGLITGGPGGFIQGARKPEEQAPIGADQNGSNTAAPAPIIGARPSNPVVAAVDGALDQEVSLDQAIKDTAKAVSDPKESALVDLSKFYSDLGGTTAPGTQQDSELNVLHLKAYQAGATEDEIVSTIDAATRGSDTLTRAGTEAWQKIVEENKAARAAEKKASGLEFLDLMKSEQSDLEARRGVVDQQRQARAQDYLKQDAIRRESELESAQGRIMAQRMLESRNARFDILDGILAQPDIKNPLAKFEAELKRNGYRYAQATPAEEAHAERHAGIAGALTETEVIPSTPNEMDAGLIREKKVTASPLTPTAPKTVAGAPVAALDTPELQRLASDPATPANTRHDAATAVRTQETNAPGPSAAAPATPSTAIPQQQPAVTVPTQQGPDSAAPAQPAATTPEWQAFHPASGTLAIPRAEMPQIKAEHRGAMVNFLNARGISHTQEEVPASTLKATQAEFSPAKVEQARKFEGGDRSILISSDNHILDGHHQALAKLNEPIKVIRLNAPIRDLLPTVAQFPSAETAASQDKQPERPAPVAAPSKAPTAEAPVAAAPLIAEPATPKIGGAPVTEIRVETLRGFARSRNRRVAGIAQAEITRREEEKRVRSEAKAATENLKDTPSRDLLRIVKAMGGINSDHALTVVGDRGVRGLGEWATVFKRQKRNPAGVISQGHGMDEVALELERHGYMTKDELESDGSNVAERLVRDAIAGQLEPITEAQVQKAAERTARERGERQDAEAALQAEGAPVTPDNVQTVISMSDALASLSPAEIDRLDNEFGALPLAQFETAVIKYVEDRNANDQGRAKGVRSGQETGGEEARAPATAAEVAPLELASQSAEDIAAANDKARADENKAKSEAAARAAADKAETERKAIAEASTKAADDFSLTSTAAVDKTAQKKADEQTATQQLSGQRDIFAQALQSVAAATEKMADAVTALAGKGEAKTEARARPDVPANARERPDVPAAPKPAEQARDGNIEDMASKSAAAKIDENTGLPLNDDGTVSVYHHTTPQAAAEIRATGVLRSAAEPDVYVTSRAEQDTGYGDTSVLIRVDPDRLTLDDEFPDGRRDFRLNVGRPGGQIKVKVQNESAAGNSVPALPVDAGQEKIDDFGEKIGGARKDTAQSTGSRGKDAAAESAEPGWRKRFFVSQIVSGSHLNDEEGKWVLHDSRQKDWAGKPKQIGHPFETKEAAEKSIPLIAVVQKHRAVPVRRENVTPMTEAEVDAMVAKDGAAVEAEYNRPGRTEYMVIEGAKRRLAKGDITQAGFDNVVSKYGEAAKQYTPPTTPIISEKPDPQTAYEIWRDVTDRKRVKVVDKQFATREDALRYMGEHAVEIIETKTAFGEEILVKPDKVMRSGVDRRNGPATAKMFSDTFGFRGVEFGNWNNQDERQDVMNHAYDGLLDLADVLDVPPKALSLNGDLALAFGARGQGLSGAKAHYERDYGVINLTKMTGAGSLAHEWFHATDHYLGRQDTKAKSERIKNDAGDMVYPAGTPRTDYASHGFKALNSKVREELRAAYKYLINTMFTKAERYVEDTKKAEKFVGGARERLAQDLKEIRIDLTRGPESLTHMSRNNKPASAEQLAAFDQLADQLIAGQDLATEFRYNKPGNTPARNRGALSGRHSNDTLDAISAILKAVRGRSGFSAEQHGKLDGTRYLMKTYRERIAMLESANTNETKEKRVPTAYAMDAKRIDQGRASDYWTTEHEMAARAFSAYVEDKVAEQGNKSDFLAYGSDNKFYAMMGLRPFPEGAEREAINAAFDKFFKTVETRETDTGTAMLSRRTTSTTGLSIRDAQAVFDRISPNFKNLPPVTILNRPGELPDRAKDLRDQIKKQGAWNDVEAAFVDGEIFAFADNVRDEERFEHVIFSHEVTHFGLRGIMGKGLDAQLSGLLMRNPELRKQATETRKRLKLGSHVEAVEEVLADMKDADLAKLKGVDRLISFMRDWFQSHGFTKLAERLDAILVNRVGEQVAADALVGDIVRAAREFARNGKPEKTSLYMGGTRFAGGDNINGMNRVESLIHRLKATEAKFEPLRKSGKGLSPEWNAVEDEAKTIRRELIELTGDAYGQPKKVKRKPPPYEKLEAEYSSPDEVPPDVMEWARAQPILTSDASDAVRWGRIVDTLRDERHPDSELTIYRAVENGGDIREGDWVTTDREYAEDHLSRYLGGRGGVVEKTVNGKDVLVSPTGNVEEAIYAPREFSGPYKGTKPPGPPSEGRGASVDREPRFSRSVGQEMPTNNASWDAPEPSKMDNFLYTMQDKHVDTKKVIQAIKKNRGALADAHDVYLQEELFHGRVAKLVDDFLAKELNPLMIQMGMRGFRTTEDIQAFEKYLHARHAPERNREMQKRNPTAAEIPQRVAELEGQIADARAANRNKEANSLQSLADALQRQKPYDGDNTDLSGMSTKDANDYIKGLEPTKLKAYETLAGMVDAINTKTEQHLVEKRLESQATIDAWKKAYKHYVPLQREDMDGGPGIGQGFAVKGSASKRATGSKRAVVDILANIAMQRESAIVRGEKSPVSNAIVGLAVANPNDEFWKVDTPPKIKYIDEHSGLVKEGIDPLYKQRENVITARTLDGNGDIVEHAVIFNERDERAARMARALKNLDADQLGEVLGNVAKMTRYFASINTQYNPIFGVVNIARDTQGAMLNLSTTPIANKKSEVLKNTLSALKGIYIDLRDKRAGKEATSAWANEFEEFQNEGGQTGYRDMFRTSKDRGEAIAREINKVKEGKAKQFGRAVFDWLSDYNTAMENAVRLAAYKVAKDSGMSKQQSASLAKNLTVNFNRKGQAATQVGALYAFFNASVQGTARLSEVLRGPAGRKIIIGGITLGAIQALLLAAAGFDDNEPPDFVRERNLIIPIGDKKYITIPMPLGLHFIPNLGRIPTEFALSGFKNPAKRIGSLFNVFADAFNPVGSAGLSLQTITPTIIDPLAALAENKDWTGKPIAKPDLNPLSPTPGHKRAKDTATAISKAVSQGLNWITGGTDYRPGFFSPTPDQIDFLGGQVTGGLGREVMKVEQSVASQFSGEDLPPYKIPLVGRFYGDAEAGASQAGPFYDNLKLLNQHEAEIKGRAKAHEPLGDYLQENPEARLFQYGNMVEKRMSVLRKHKSELIAKDAPREQVKAIEDQMTTIMKSLNERVRRAQDRIAA